MNRSDASQSTNKSHFMNFALRVVKTVHFTRQEVTKKRNFMVCESLVLSQNDKLLNKVYTANFRYQYATKQHETFIPIQISCTKNASSICEQQVQ